MHIHSLSDDPLCPGNHRPPDRKSAYFLFSFISSSSSRRTITSSKVSPNFPIFINRLAVCSLMRIVLGIFTGISISPYVLLVYQNWFFVIFVILQQCYFIKYIMYCNNVTINPKKLCRILFGCYSHLYPCKHAGINGEVSVWRRKWENFLKSNGKNFVRESLILFLWEWMPENWTQTSNGWIWKILNNCIFF